MIVVIDNFDHCFVGVISDQFTGVVFMLHKDLLILMILNKFPVYMMNLYGLCIENEKCSDITYLPIVPFLPTNKPSF